MRAIPILLLAVALTTPAPAVAAGLRPWLGFGGSLGQYGMFDVNREIDTLDELLGGTIPPTDLSLAQIASGPGCGVSGGADFGKGFSLGIGYDRLFASSGAEGPDGYLQIRLPANAFRGIAEYAFPRRGPLGARVGVAAGVVSVTGQLVGEVDEAGRIVSEAVRYVRGSGPLFEAYLGGDWWAQPRCGIVATVGYRRAPVDEVKVGGEVERNDDGSNFHLDYSGMLLRLGLKVPLGVPEGVPAAPASGAIKPWLRLDGSWGNYGMLDTNYDIEAINAEVLSSGDTVYAHLDEIHHGFGFGGSAGLDFPGHVTLGVGYDRLSASTKASADVSVEYRLPADAYRGFVEYRFAPEGRYVPRVGVATGVVMLTGCAALDFSSLDETDHYALKGSGALVEAYVGGDWLASSRLAVTFTGGYRHAKVNEVKANDTAILVEPGHPYVADYSGMILRLGLKVALTK